MGGQGAEGWFSDTLLEDSLRPWSFPGRWGNKGRSRKTIKEIGDAMEWTRGGPRGGFWKCLAGSADLMCPLISCGWVGRSGVSNTHTEPTSEGSVLVHNKIALKETQMLALFRTVFLSPNFTFISFFALSFSFPPPWLHLVIMAKTDLVKAYCPLSLFLFSSSPI